MVQSTVSNAIETFIVSAWNFLSKMIFLEFKMIRAAFALRITATDVVPMIIISLLFACVEPASVFTARSVQPWSSAVMIVTRCIVS